MFSIPLDGRELKIDLSAEGVPQDTYEVIIYPYMKSGNNDHQDADGSFVFSTFAQHGKNERSLFFHIYDQNAWSFNSENITLPLYREPYVYAKIDRAVNYQGFSGSVKVVGYRKS